jgi:hypothetical protein
MKRHYSKPKGFVGRNLCYAVFYDTYYYGHIVAGSATKNLPGRHEFLGTTHKDLNNIINNIFYSVEKYEGRYPCRNFTSSVLIEFMKRSARDWHTKYGDLVRGFESLVEMPRTGDLYIKAGWVKVGQTKGYTCKRVAGYGTDLWSGRRLWDMDNLRPKVVLCSRNMQ